MGTARVWAGLSKDELAAKAKLAEQSGASIYYADGSTLIETKLGQDIEKTIEPLTFMISLDKDWYRDKQWTITSKDADELIGYTVTVLDPPVATVAPTVSRS